jgi:hypothetical protein
VALRLNAFSSTAGQLCAQKKKEKMKNFVGGLLKQLRLPAISALTPFLGGFYGCAVFD